jgi:hypothetical protein
LTTLLTQPHCSQQTFASVLLNAELFVFSQSRYGIASSFFPHRFLNAIKLNVLFQSSLNLSNAWQSYTVAG